MPLEAGFGIELLLLIEINDEWRSIYTYYNHGLKPPYGGVKSEETGEEIVVKVEIFDLIMNRSNQWVRFIKNIVKSPIEQNPDIPLDYKLSLQDNGDSLILDFVMGPLDSHITWDKSTDVVKFKARDAFDISWKGFLFYLKALEDFSHKIKGYS